MTLFDTHAHVTDGAGLDGIARAASAGVGGVIAVGGSAELNRGAKAAVAEFGDFAHLALGWDRSCAVGGVDAVQWLKAEHGHYESTESPLRAIGEIGLDYFYEKGNKEKQRELFECQVALAGELGLPVIVHSREADEDTLAILGNAGSKALASRGRLGVLHCFTGTQAFATALLERGMMVSFSGIVTFANAHSLRAVAKAIPAERLLIETDCPYLTPVPHRGKPNEPAFVKHVAECLAKARGVGVEEVARVTTENARRLFNL